MKKKKGPINHGVEWTKSQINFVLSKYKLGYTRTEISKMYNTRFLKDKSERTPNSIKHCIEVYGQHITKDKPKLLFVDVETKPAKAYVWQQYDNNVPLEMLIEDGSILSFCAKWAGDPESKIIYRDMRGKEKNLLNDKQMMKELWKLMDEATHICWHNGNRFDKGKINARFIQHGLGAPSEYKSIDTLVIAKNNFNFFSNKLQHLSALLAKKNKKDSHSEFPGFKLWDECLKGNKRAWKSMQVYNSKDVLALEEVFLELAKYVKGNANVATALRAYEKG